MPVSRSCNVWLFAGVSLIKWLSSEQSGSTFAIKWRMFGIDLYSNNYRAVVNLTIYEAQDDNNNHEQSDVVSLFLR